MDNFREWLSDNLRYILLGLAIILVLGVSIFVVRLVRGTGGSSNKTPISLETQAQTETQAQADTQSSTAQTAETAAQTEAQTESEEALTENDAALLAFAEKFYEAYLNKDVDTYTSLVENASDADIAEVQADKAYESYENFKVYSKSGPEENSYVLLISFDAKAPSIETLVPSLAWLYVKTAEDGSLYSADYKDDANLTAQLEAIIKQSDIQELIKTVRTALDQAKASDPDLAALLDTSSTGDSGTDSDDSTQSETVVWATADEVNIRADASMDADVIGTLPYQAQVTRISKLDSGWSQIRYGETTGYVYSEYLTEDESYFSSDASAE